MGPHDQIDKQAALVKLDKASRSIDSILTSLNEKGNGEFADILGSSRLENTYSQMLPSVVGSAIARRYLLQRFTDDLEYEVPHFTSDENEVLDRLTEHKPIRNTLGRLVRAVTKLRPPKNDEKLVDRKISRNDPFFEELCENRKDQDASLSPIEDELSIDQTNIPKLFTGYISGSEEEDTNLGEGEIASLRRNRRGQRARRKIWERKYGANAKHLVEEREKRLKILEEKARKFELRKQRRNLSKAGQANKIREKEKSNTAKDLHPSWLAHIEQKQAQARAKFQGKKILFN